MNQKRDILDTVKEYGSKRNLGGKIVSKILDQPPPIKMASYLRKEAGLGNMARGAVGWLKAKPLTNIVNTLKAFKTPIKSMKAGFAPPLLPGQSKTGLRINQALLLATTPMGATEAFSKEDPTGAGRGRPERALRWAGRQAGGLIGLPHGFISGPLVGSVVGETGGALVGKAIGKVTGSGRSSTQLPFQQMASHNPPTGPFYGQ